MNFVKIFLLFVSMTLVSGCGLSEKERKKVDNKVQKVTDKRVSVISEYKKLVKDNKLLDEILKKRITDGFCAIKFKDFKDKSEEIKKSHFVTDNDMARFHQSFNSVVRCLFDNEKLIGFAEQYCSGSGSDKKIQKKVEQAYKLLEEDRKKFPNRKKRLDKFEKELKILEKYVSGKSTCKSDEDIKGLDFLLEQASKNKVLDIDKRIDKIIKMLLSLDGEYAVKYNNLEERCYVVMATSLWDDSVDYEPTHNIVGQQVRVDKRTYKKLLSDFSPEKEVYFSTAEKTLKKAFVGFDEKSITEIKKYMKKYEGLLSSNLGASIWINDAWCEYWGVPTYYENGEVEKGKLEEIDEQTYRNALAYPVTLFKPKGYFLDEAMVNQYEIARYVATHKDAETDTGEASSQGVGGHNTSNRVSNLVEDFLLYHLLFGDSGGNQSVYRQGGRYIPKHSTEREKTFENSIGSGVVRGHYASKSAMGRNVKSKTSSFRSRGPGGKGK